MTIDTLTAKITELEQQYQQATQQLEQAKAVVHGISGALQILTLLRQDEQKVLDTQKALDALPTPTV